MAANRMINSFMQDTVSGVKFSPIGFLRDMSMTALIIWLVCPYQNFFGNWYIYGVLWAVWIACALFSEPDAFSYMISTKYTVALFSWPVATFVLSLFDHAEFAVYQFTIPFMLMAFVYYAKSKNITSVRWFITVYAVYALMIGVNSVTELMENPEISRILASSDKSITSRYAGPFTANFSFVNNLVAIGVFLTFFFKNTNEKKLKFASVFLIAFAMLLLALAQYTIAILTFALFFFVVLVWFGKNKKNTTFKTVLAVFVIIFAALMLGRIFTFLSTLVPEGYISRRLYSLGKMFGTGTVDQSTDLADRIGLYTLSLQTFFKNFLIGVGGKTFMAHGLVGGHSQILDNFAYYGVFFGSQFVLYLICAYKNGVKFLKGAFAKGYLLVFVSYMVNCTVNTCYNEEMLFVTFFIIPCMFYLMQSGEERLKAESAE